MVRDHQISIFAWLHVRFLEWVFHWGFLFGWGLRLQCIYAGNCKQFIKNYLELLIVIHHNARLFFRNFFGPSRTDIYDPARRTVTRLHYPPRKTRTKLRQRSRSAATMNRHCGEFGRTCGLERLFWVNRGVTYQLIRDGKIKSCSLRKPAAQTGVRLIHLASVRKFVESNLK